MRIRRTILAPAILAISTAGPALAIAAPAAAATPNLTTYHASAGSLAPDLTTYHA